MYNKIMSEIKEAMKNKETDKKDVLKMALTKAQNIAKENKCDATNDIILDAIKKELKQLDQTKKSLEGKEDSDLYKSTVYKIEVLNKYLPDMLSRKDVMLRVVVLLEDERVKNKGEAMKIIMKELKGKADNRDISECVDEYLKSR